MSPISGSYEFIRAEINDAHAMFDRQGVPRTHAGERLSLGQRARMLEDALTRARVAAAAVGRAKRRATSGGDTGWREVLG
jgi:hypothetical protein